MHSRYSLRHRFPNNPETDIADSQCWTVIAVSRGDALIGTALIPASTTHHGKSGRKAVQGVQRNTVRPHSEFTRGTSRSATPRKSTLNLISQLLKLLLQC